MAAVTLALIVAGVALVLLMAAVVFAVGGQSEEQRR